MLAKDTLFPITEAQRTAHARQLKSGFRDLRFEAPLEQAFLIEAERGLGLLMAWLATLLLVIWSGFWLSDGLRLHSITVATHQAHLLDLITASRATVMAFLVTATVLAWRKRHEAPRRRWVVVGALLITVCGSLSSTCYLRLGAPHVMESLMLLIAGLFLPLGMTLRQAAPLALACLAVALLTGLAMLTGNDLFRHLYTVFLMLITGLLAAFGAYWREYAQRQQFLLRAELGWQANHDPMTGLSNRRMFDEHLDSLLRQARRENQALALVLADVDWFKRFNDRYGHPAGDAALQSVADVLQSVVSRPLDMAARLGGEEMALILFGAQATDAVRLAELAAQRLRELAIEHADAPQGRLSLSQACTMAQPDDTPSSIYQRCDRLLYRAKTEGRDRLVFGP